jgi:hypothetical protein
MLHWNFYVDVSDKCSYEVCTKRRLHANSIINLTTVKYDKFKVAGI